MVFWNSNHSHEHVLAELEAYAPLVSSGGYLVVFDTMIDELDDDCFKDRPWGLMIIKDCTEAIFAR